MTMQDNEMRKIEITRIETHTSSQKKSSKTNARTPVSQRTSPVPIPTKKKRKERKAEREREREREMEDDWERERVSNMY